MNQQIQQGTILSGRYTLLRELTPSGSGQSQQTIGDSGVWLARDEQSADEVSIRILSSNSNWAPVYAARSRLAALIHPHILRTLDMGEQDAGTQPGGMVYIVCNFVEGLEELVLDPDNPGQTCRTLIPLLEALEFAHSLGVVHGALSRHCLMQDAQGSVLLSGFGSELVSLEKHANVDHISPQVLARQLPQISDDVYSIGALLFFIFTGNPWSREVSRITDFSLLPDPLQSLIASMVSDSPYERPPQVAFVISSLEDYLDPSRSQLAQSIEATSFRKSPGSDPDSPGTASSPGSNSARPKTPREQHTIPVATALSFLAVLMLILLVVFLYQPGSVNQPLDAVQDTKPANGPAKEPVQLESAAQPDSPAPYELAQLERLQEEAKTLAATLLREQIELEDRGATLWAPEKLVSVQSMADQGDSLFRDRQFSEAIESYKAGLKLLDELRLTIPEVLATNLANGKQALAEGESATAIQAFTIASSIEPANSLAAEGLRRANNLDALNQELAMASDLERADSLEEALSAFNRALALDPVSGSAKQGVARVSAELRQRKFNNTMSAGFIALQTGDFRRARESFRVAQQLIPDSPLPEDGLNQVDIADRLQQIEALQHQAERHELAENWAGARSDYEAALRLDETLVFAQNGIQRASDRLELQEKLSAFIDDPLLLRDENSLIEAKDALYQATLISTPGPLLAGKITAIARSIKLARVPVKVDFISDQQTDIIVYKVKQLGRIDRVSLDLIPGRYTVVGARKGYRDTRLEFAVQPGQETATISVICSDRI